MSGLVENTDHIFGPQFYKKMPRRWRREDHAPEEVVGFSKHLKYHERFLHIFGDTYDEIRRDYINILKYTNPLECPEDILSRLAQNRGWALNESLTEDFKRLLIRNIRQIYKLAGTERGIWYAIYIHTGINVQILRCNSPYTVKPAKSGYLAEPYASGSEYLTLFPRSDAPVPGERIWVHLFGTIGNGIIESVTWDGPNYRVYLKNGLGGYTFPEEALWTIRNEYFPGAGSKVSIGGRRFMRVGDKIGIGRVGSKTTRNITAGMQRENLTLAINWPFDPVAEFGAEKGNNIINMATDLTEYMKPYRSYYVFNFKDFEPYKFVVGLSKVGSRDRVGEA